MNWEMEKYGVDSNWGGGSEINTEGEGREREKQ